MIPWNPAMTFWSIVGQARRQTAGTMGPSTIVRSKSWAFFGAGADIPVVTAGRTRCSGLDDDLEPPHCHALHVEGHRLRVHHGLHSRVLHHFRVDAIAIGLRLVDDPGEDDRLPTPELRQFRETPPRLELVSHGLEIFERAVLAPDLPGLLRDPAVGGQFLLRQRNHETIDVTGHGESPLFISERESESIISYAARPGSTDPRRRPRDRGRPSSRERPVCPGSRRSRSSGESETGNTPPPFRPPG